MKYINISCQILVSSHMASYGYWSNTSHTKSSPRKWSKVDINSCTIYYIIYIYIHKCNISVIYPIIYIYIIIKSSHKNGYLCCAIQETQSASSQLLRYLRKPTTLGYTEQTCWIKVEENTKRI